MTTAGRPGRRRTGAFIERRDGDARDLGPHMPGKQRAERTSLPADLHPIRWQGAAPTSPLRRARRPAAQNRRCVTARHCPSAEDPGRVASGLEGARLSCHSTYRDSDSGRVGQRPRSHVWERIDRGAKLVKNLGRWAAYRGSYSMRRPLIALEMTSCWICSVPSKMSMVSRIDLAVSPGSVTCGSRLRESIRSARFRRVLVQELVPALDRKGPAVLGGIA